MASESRLHTRFNDIPTRTVACIVTISPYPFSYRFQTAQSERGKMKIELGLHELDDWSVACLGVISKVVTGTSGLFKNRGLVVFERPGGHDDDDRERGKTLGLFCKSSESYIPSCPRCHAQVASRVVSKFIS